MDAAPGPAPALDDPAEPVDVREAPGRAVGATGGDAGAVPPPAQAVVSPADDPQGAPFSSVLRVLLVVGAVVAIAAGLVLRFWTRSDLWLDEALTVDIAGVPVHQIPSYLRRDGAPPLFYVLLHFWMLAFGRSDVAVRALPGVFGVVTLPLAWLAGKRLAGRTGAWAALLLVATSPFAVRYDTEARMYSLVVLLTVCGFLALDRALRAPRAGNLVAVGAVAALLLYTHYWSIYLLATTVLWLAYQAWRGQEAWRRGARAALVAVLIGCLAFLPWVPTFLFQSAHTGTPWATPASFAAMVSAIASFAGGNSSQGRGLALLFFALVGLGLFGLATDRLHIDLDIRTRPAGRPLAVVITGTLAAAIAGGLVSSSAFDARYASVVFMPLILLVALGLTVFRDRHVRAGVLALAVVLGLGGCIPNVTTNRTQAGQVAAVINRTGRPGDVVAYCPDQLGPAVNRLLPEGRYQQTTFPRGTGPAFVDWVDYAEAVHAASPVAFADHVESLAGGTHDIYMVWGGGYQAFGTKCEGIVQTLQADPAYRGTAEVVGDNTEYFQPMSLIRFTPTGT